MTPPELHKVCEAAKLVGKSPSWLYQRGAAGEHDRTKIGGNVFYTDEQIAKIIRDGEQKAKKPKQSKPREQRDQAPAQKMQDPAPAKAAKQRKRQAAPPATAANIPQADRSVSRLYKHEVSA